MTKEQPQIRINPEEIEVEAEKAAAAAAATAEAGGEAFDDLEARDEGKEADAGEAADNTSVDGTNALSSPSTKRCNRFSGVIFGSSILLLLAALVGGGYSLQRSRNQISTAMNKPPADCKGKDAEKDKKCAGKSTCSSDDVGLYLDEKYVGKELEEGKNQVGKYVALAHTAMLEAIMFELVFESAYVAVELACRENVMIDDVGVALGNTGFKFNVIRREQKLDLKVNKAAEKLVKDVNNQGRGGFGGRGRGCRGRGRGGRGRERGLDGGRGRGGRGGRGRREVELEKDATTLIQHAVENSFKSIHGYARKAAKGGPIRPKHVVLGAKKALPSPYFKIVMVALVETIISCACEGKLNINLRKLAKWLKSLGMMYGGRRLRIDTTATLTLGIFRQATAQSVLNPSIVDALAAGRSVIGKSDITASVGKDADLKAYFEKLPPVEYILGDLPKEAASLARQMDPGISLTLEAELFVDELTSRALHYTAGKTFEYAEENKMAEIKADTVTFVVKKASKPIAGITDQMFKVASSSFKECKKSELPEIDDDLQLTEELLLEFDAIDFEDEGEDPED